MNKKLYKLMNWPEIEALVYNEIADPYEILGVKKVGSNLLFQMYYKDAEKVELIIGDTKTDSYNMEMADENGFFACLIAGKPGISYKYRVTKNGKTFDFDDIYSIDFDSYKIPENELIKFGKGINYSAYKYLGAHILNVDNRDGVRFAVWAPNAVSVSVVGEFNDFTPSVYQMKKDDNSGVFELFIPGIREGEAYQYIVKTKNGHEFTKNDPYSRAYTADGLKSIITETKYIFDDSEYIDKRSKLKDISSPMSIYQVDLNNFKQANKKCLDFKKITEYLLNHVQEMGYTHVELLPIMECDDRFSTGMTTVGFYAPASKYGKADELKYLIDMMHKNGIGVILDWAPFHFANIEDGLKNFDGTCLYEHLDERKGTHPFFGTKQFNYARPEVTSYLISNANYWIDEYHVDGLKMLSVASMLYLDYGRNEGEWIPNIYGGNENLDAIEFIKHLNSIMEKNHKDIMMIAYDDSGFPNITTSVELDGLGFDYKLNNSMVQDSIAFLSQDPLYRPYHFSELTFDMLYQYSENYISGASADISPIESVYLLDSMYGEELEKFSNLKLYFGYLMTHPGKKLIFEGQDLGLSGKFDENIELNWKDVSKKYNKGIKKLIIDLNKLYKSLPSLYSLDNKPEGFEWINGMQNDECVLSYLRKTNDEKDTLLVVFNFANVENECYVGTPYPGKYKEVINTDDSSYGGQNIINKKSIAVSSKGANGREYSVKVKLAPLSMAIFKYSQFTEAEKYKISKKKEAAIAQTKAQEYHKMYEEAKSDADIASKKIEAAKAELEAAKERMKSAMDNENIELKKAQKALEESK